MHDVSETQLVSCSDIFPGKACALVAHPKLWRCSKAAVFLPLLHSRGSRTFSSSKHTRAIEPHDKEKKAKLLLYFPQFPQYLEDNALQPGIMTKKYLLCSCKCIYYSRPTTLTWQCVQRDNFRWRERWPLRMLKACTRDRKQNLIWCFLWILSEWTSRVEEVDPRR